MACEHSDYCVTCLRIELANVRNQRDRLVAGIESVLRREGPGRFSVPQTQETPALTPPDSPSRKEKAEKAFVVSTATHIFRKNSEGTFVADPNAALVAESAARDLELEAQVASLDPPFLKQEPKPTVAYNPLEAAVVNAQNSVVAVEMMAEAAKAESRRKKRSKAKKSPQKPAAKKKSGPKPPEEKKPAGNKREHAKARANSDKKGAKKAPATKEVPISRNDYLTTNEVELLIGRAAHLIAVDCREGKVPSIKSYAGKILLRRGDLKKYASYLTQKAKVP